MPVFQPAATAATISRKRRNPVMAVILRSSPSCQKWRMMTRYEGKLPSRFGRTEIGQSRYVLSTLLRIDNALISI
jgi:hypothetical protein